MKHIICIILGLSFLCLFGCKKEVNQSEPLLVTVEGDDSTKAEIEKMIRRNPVIYVKNSTEGENTTEYSLQIVEPDSGLSYSIIRVEPDPNTEYSINIYDPDTNKPPSNFDKNVLEAIKKELENRKVKVKEK